MKRMSYFAIGAVALVAVLSATFRYVVHAREALAPSKVVDVTFKSQALNKNMTMSVYLPPGYDPSKRYPVLYMLHGYSGDHTYWFSVMKLNLVADELLKDHQIDPLIIVAPDMNNSFGLNSAPKVTVLPGDAQDNQRDWNWYEGPYESYLVKDVIGYIDSHFAADKEAKSRYIGGVSMGGFIALHDAFVHPDLFSKVSGDSPAIATRDGNENFPFADYNTREKWDPAYLAQQKNLSSMDVYLDCGLQDEFGFYVPTQELYQTLKARGVKVQLHLSKGTHSGAYWRAHQVDYLKFFAGHIQ